MPHICTNTRRSAAGPVRDPNWADGTARKLCRSTFCRTDATAPVRCARSLPHSTRSAPAQEEATSHVPISLLGHVARRGHHRGSERVPLAFLVRRDPACSDVGLRRRASARPTGATERRGDLLGPVEDGRPVRVGPPVALEADGRRGLRSADRRSHHRFPAPPQPGSGEGEAQPGRVGAPSRTR